MRCWHDAIVRDGALEDLTDSNPERPPNSTDATRALARLPFVGPYLVKSPLGVLTLTKRIHFDVGVVSPGSYSSAVLADRRPRVDESAAVAVEQGPPMHAPLHRKSLGRWKGAIGKICRQHCAIGILGAAFLNKAPCTPTGANKRKIWAMGSDLQWSLEARTNLGKSEVSYNTNIL